jgi:hypothetical protein
MARGHSPEAHVEEQAARRRSRALEGLIDAIDSSSQLVVPDPVERKDMRPGKAGPPKLPLEAFELARQVYYLQHGTLSDAARAVIAAGHSETADHVVVFERLKTWWTNRGWPRRPTDATFAIRDANGDGGLFRSERICNGVATGSGPAPKGKACTQSALPGQRQVLPPRPPA